MLEHSESIGAISAAIAKAQAELENATKNAKNPHFGNAYSDLAAVLNEARPVYAKHGVAMTQHPDLIFLDATALVVVETLFSHESGEWIKNTLHLPVAKLDAQGVGSATTYGRRYGGSAMANIAQEDDDGQAASTGTATPRVAKAWNEADERTYSILITSIKETYMACNQEDGWEKFRTKVEAAKKQELASSVLPKLREHLRLKEAEKNKTTTMTGGQS